MGYFIQWQPLLSFGCVRGVIGQGFKRLYNGVGHNGYAEVVELFSCLEHSLMRKLETLTQVWPRVSCDQRHGRNLYRLLLLELYCWLPRATRVVPGVATAKLLTVYIADAGTPIHASECAMGLTLALDREGISTQNSMSIVACHWFIGRQTAGTEHSREQSREAVIGQHCVSVRNPYRAHQSPSLEYLERC